MEIEEASSAPSNSAVSQRAVKTVRINIGTFNFGVHQAQIASKLFTTKGVLPKVRRVVSRMVDEGDLHLLTACEMGGHRQGLQAADVYMESILENVLDSAEYEGFSRGAYAAIYHIAGVGGEAYLSRGDHLVEEAGVAHVAFNLAKYIA